MRAVERVKPNRRYGTWTAAVTFLLIAGGLVAAYYMNNPTPDGVCNPWKYSAFVAVKRIAVDMAYTASLFTSSHYFQLLRVLADRSSQLMLTPPEVEGSNIRSSEASFGGVGVRLYEPVERSGEPAPAVVFMHGGAFVIGSAAMFDSLTRRIAEELNCVLVSVDYRLAPEHPFPAAFEDSLRAIKWLIDHAGEYGVDPARVGVMGDSAGGALAAAVAQSLHDQAGYPSLAFQALVYPITQLIDNHTPAALQSVALFGEKGSVATWREAGEFTCLYLLGRLEPRVVQALMDNTHTSKEFRQSSPLAQYVNHTILPARMRHRGDGLAPSRGEDGLAWALLGDVIVDERASPLLRPDMAGLPPTFVATCEYDALRDHGAFYALRLRDAGVPVTWEHYQGGFHGVFGPSGVLVFEVGETMFRDLIQFAKERLELVPQE